MGVDQDFFGVSVRWGSDIVNIWLRKNNKRKCDINNFSLELAVKEVDVAGGTGVCERSVF